MTTRRLSSCMRQMHHDRACSILVVKPSLLLLLLLQLRLLLLSLPTPASPALHRCISHAQRHPAAPASLVGSRCASMRSFRFPASETMITAERHLAEASCYQHQGGPPLDGEEQDRHPGERLTLGEWGLEEGRLGRGNGSLSRLPFLGLRGGAGATRKRKIYRDRCPSSMDLIQDAEVGVVNVTGTTLSSMPNKQGTRRLVDAVEVAATSSTTSELMKRRPSSMGQDGMCRQSGCTTRACFGMPGGAAMTCNNHRKAGYEDVLNIRCSHAGCNRSAIFGDPSASGQHHVRFCLSHRNVERHVNLRARRCDVDRCFKQPSYGPKMGSGAERCAEHRLPGYINVVSKRCRVEGCGLHPSFGDPAAWLPVACGEHREPGHTLVIGSRCAAFNCSTRARYKGVGESGKPTRCFNHRLPTDMDATTSRCKSVGGCARQAIYGKEGCKRMFCGAHKTEDCVNLAIKRRLCDRGGCKKRATHGVFGESPRYCGQHAPRPPEVIGNQSGAMIENLVVRRCKAAEGCHKIPTWSRTHGEGASFCFLHRPSGYIRTAGGHLVGKEAEADIDDGDDDSAVGKDARRRRRRRDRIPRNGGTSGSPQRLLHEGHPFEHHGWDEGLQGPVHLQEIYPLHHGPDSRVMSPMERSLTERSLSDLSVVTEMSH